MSLQYTLTIIKKEKILNQTMEISSKHVSDFQMKTITEFPTRPGQYNHNVCQVFQVLQQKQ